MSAPHPDYERFTGHWVEEDTAMDVFAVRFARWRIVRLFSRNPLVRISDRIEALILALTVVLALLVVPVAAAVGTAVYDSRRQLDTEQAQSRRTVVATVVDENAAQISPNKTAPVQVRWFAAEAEHTGAIKVGQKVKPGDSIDIWVDQDGSHVGPPMRTAADAAVATALAIWLAATGAAVASFIGARALLNRSRYARWQHDFDRLVGDGNAHTGKS